MTIGAHPGSSPVRRAALPRGHSGPHPPAPPTIHLSDSATSGISRPAGSLTAQPPMSIAYCIDKQRGVTLALWHGVVTADAFLAHVRRLCSDPDWPPRQRLHLTDLSAALFDSSMDNATIEKAAQIYGQHHAKLMNMKVAIVAHKGFEKAQVFEQAIATYGATGIVFNFLHSACEWLDLDTQQVQTTLQQLRAQSAAPPNP